MDGLSLAFLDLWTFVVSQLGLIALGWIARGYLDPVVKAATKVLKKDVEVKA